MRIGWNGRTAIDGENRFYPIFLSLQDRICLVVGGGAVAERKIAGLLRFGPFIRIVAKDLTPWLSERCDGTRVQWIGKSYEAGLLDTADLVFAATSDIELNRRISADARERKLWCNMASDPERGSFIVPSLVVRGPLSLAVSTGGASPALARKIKEKLEKEFGPEWGPYLRLMAHLRRMIQSGGLDSSENQGLFRAIAALPILSWIREGRREEIFREIHEICQSRLDIEELNALLDELWNPFSSSSQPCVTPSEPSAT
jgi:precorrin-2 dehydrogenase / sirohydrochlorin ferrochelatase